MAGFAQRPGHPGRVRGPPGHRSGLERVDRQRDRIAAGLPGYERDLSVRPPRGRGADAGTDGEWQHEYLVVVRAADQVDPARREPGAFWFTAVLPGEPRAGVRRRPRRGGGSGHWIPVLAGSPVTLMSSQIDTD